ncbi:uncharacterized protein RJT21DRAFT_119009, partial [Scheffersomyces amazonensis]|uniref:uncharacterized protein n=1 Tax=Scheffersomyces amazonensis TaxID=1078765 RepID=UPI00315DC0CE
PTGPTGPTNPTGPTGPTVPTTPTRPTTPTSRTTSTGSTNRGTSTSGRTSASRTASTSPTTVRKSSAPTKPTVQETSRREPSDITAPSIAPLFAIDEDGNKISLSTIEILVNATADEIAKRENRKAIAGLTYLVADITDSSGFYIQDGRLYDADGRTVVNQDSKFITFASEGGLIGFEHSENGYLSFRGESNFYYCYLDGGNTTFKAVSLEDTGSCNVTSLILGGSADEGSTMITTVFLFTETRTITECSSTVTDCPGSSKFVHTITTTYCPDTEPGPYTITLYAAVETGDGGDIQTRTFITTIGDTSLSSSVQGSGPTEIPTFNSAGTLTRGLGLVMAACIIFLL